MRLESAGICLFVSNPLPGTPALPLSYSPNDSRLEQRAAMHLQLSRQYPNTTWLTQFRLLEMPASLPSGAKFLATWTDGRQVIGQLWMPAKSNAAMVRVRASAPLAQARGAGAAVTAPIKQAVEQELRAIAIQWAASYE
jgi:hypothetical protein